MNVKYLCSLQINLYSEPFCSDHPARHPSRTPCPLSLPASHPTLSTTRPCLPPDPACHPTRPATLPCLPTPPACLPCLLARPPKARRRRERCKALGPSSSSCKGCMCGVQVKVQPPLISCTPHLICYLLPQIFFEPPPKFAVTVLSLIFYVPLQIFYVPHLIFYLSHLIFCSSPSIFYANLTCDAMDSRSALLLPAEMVNCGDESLLPCVRLVTSGSPT